MTENRRVRTQDADTGAGQKQRRCSAVAERYIQRIRGGVSYRPEIQAGRVEVRDGKDYLGAHRHGLRAARSVVGNLQNRGLQRVVRTRNERNGDRTTRSSG